MENPNDVTPDSSPEGKEPLGKKPPNEIHTPETPPPAEGGDPPVTPGEKTPDSNLYGMIKEVREGQKDISKRLDGLEDKSNNPDSATPPDLDEDEMSDEGKELKKSVASTNKRLDDIEKKATLKALETTYPALKDKKEDFEEYRKDFPDTPLKVIANSFLVDNDLLGEKPKRKGLEKPTGGDRTPSKTKMTSEEVKELRVNNYKVYKKMLDSGELRPEDIG